MARLRIGILISGNGSNLQALIDASLARDYGAEIALVISNRPEAYGLMRARDAGLPAELISHRDYTTREAFDDAIDAALRAGKVELVCLAGFMRVLGSRFVARWHDRLINIHPSLLPAFKGLNVHARVIAAGARVSGCTVHYVRPEVDCGPIIVQGAVPVLPADTADTLAARVLKLEHRLYPLALRLVAGGQARVDGERVRIAGREGDADAALLSPPEKD
jgi:phosphoribosylglycinamide formyltransferase-1